MKIAVPREVHAGERRVATTPDVVKRLIKLGYAVVIETGAGKAASFSDTAYVQAGANLESDARQLWQDADIILKVRAPEQHPTLGLDESELLHEGQVLVAFIWPGQNPDLIERMASTQATVMAMDAVPRISRAQKMDAMSSMGNIGGYRAIIEAANHFGRFFTGQITAAGKMPPAKVLIIGAGVAGLAAIGAAKSMGAIVRAFDTRPEVKEQVESMNAAFLELDFEEDGTGEGGYAKTMSEAFIKAELALFAEQAREVDIIVTTALIPGKPAPTLITAEMVESMHDGGVIVDLAAEQGGNCELTEPGEVIERHGVTIIGYTDLPSRLATQSSQLYANNLHHLLTDLTPGQDGKMVVDMEDEAIRGVTVIKAGKVTWPPPPSVPALPPKPAEPVAAAKPPMHERKRNPWTYAALLFIGALALWALGSIAPAQFMSHFTVFVLACFVGYQVIWNVTPALHTPLMSVTNAISGIIVIGALLQISTSSVWITVLAAVGILISTINVAGGFLVTQRMLRMFRK